MTKSKKRRRRKRGYPPRQVYRELHRHLAEFLDTLTPEEQESFWTHIPSKALSPNERLQHLQGSPLPGGLETKLQDFLEKEEFSEVFQRFFGFRSLSLTEEKHGNR